MTLLKLKYSLMFINSSLNNYSLASWTATINQSSSSYGLLKLSLTTSNILGCYIFLVVQRCTGCNVHCMVLAPDNVAAVCTG